MKVTCMEGVPPIFSRPDKTQNAAAIAILVNAVTMVAEIGVGIAVGSVAILADALHGGLDLFSSVMAFFSIRWAGQPPDKAHPFGHGKVENVSGSVEALLIIGGAGFILYEGITNLFTGHALDDLTLAIAAVVAIAVIKLVLSRYMFRVAAREGSVALTADAHHVRADFLDSAGTAIALVLIQLTGLAFIDSLAAIAIAALIAREGMKVWAASFGGLIDSSLDARDMETIEQSLNDLSGDVCGYHRIRTRRAGRERLVDLHLVVPRNLTVEQGHRIADRLEAAIEQRMSRTDVIIHLEPCGLSAPQCADERKQGVHLVDPVKHGLAH
jgi:cation diffusion facilitator family transporter